MEAFLYADTENQVPYFAAKLLWLLSNPCEKNEWENSAEEESKLSWLGTIRSNICLRRIGELYPYGPSIDALVVSDMSKRKGPV